MRQPFLRTARCSIWRSHKVDSGVEWRSPVSAKLMIRYCVQDDSLAPIPDLRDARSRTEV